ncbi:OmpA family protein [Methylomonas sp. MO1]|uniref:OmpA family protein n=1 Tax=unclassified Methylomonas TaxID=2608980 RepID=UPI0004788A40|nr:MULTISPECIES: OmpA family protein [unclassified Methylomonas]MDT4291568.1 OmpA family protein [Methylomonas sp. MO1]
MTTISLPKILTFAAALGLSGCAKSYLVLLEDHDGSTGKVIFSGANSETVIEQAGFGAALDNSKTVFKVEQEKINKDFGRALASEPVLPEIFLLYFETGGTKLTAESAALIPKIIETAGKHPAADISVIGHTDTVGDAGKNEKLANERAVQVSRLFDPSKLDVKEVAVTSHGEKNLLIKTGDETSEPRNRRVEVTIR